jgi:hypothetical protein
VLSTPAGWARVRSARSAELSTLPFGEPFCLTLFTPTSGTPFVLMRRARNSRGVCSRRTPAQSPVPDKPFRSVRAAASGRSSPSHSLPRRVLHPSRPVEEPLDLGQ